jgi:hypothetical protein
LENFVWKPTRITHTSATWYILGLVKIATPPPWRFLSTRIGFWKPLNWISSLSISWFKCVSDTSMISLFSK